MPAVLENPLDLLLALGQLVRAQHWKQPLARKLRNVAAVAKDDCLLVAQPTERLSNRWLSHCLLNNLLEPPLGQRR